jgi:uncharacterized protein YaiI (UPF0178 family)
MNVLFAGKTFDARHLEIMASNARPGDIMVLGDVKFEVETCQKNCPYIENLTKVFTQFVLKDELGQRHYSRSIFGKVEVYRKRAS